MRPQLTAPADVTDLADLGDDDTALVLGFLSTRYPTFRFCCGQVSWLGRRWIAKRIKGIDPGLHTMITADLAQLREALDLDEAWHAR